MANITDIITNLETPTWLDTGDNAWQLTAASFVALQSVPGLCVLYAGLVKKKWVRPIHTPQPYPPRTLS